MSLEKNKALVLHFIDEVMNKGNTDAINDFCIEGSMFAGGLKSQIKAMKTAFPDNHFAIKDIVAEGNQIAAKVSIRGTHTGPMAGNPAVGRIDPPLPPTGQAITITGMYFFTVAGDKIMSYAAELDMVGLLRQLGWTFTPPD